MTFQEIIKRLNHYWSRQGCVLVQPMDIEIGAGTFHPATFLRSIGPEPCSFAYVQASRRPTDGRYGLNPNRLQHYYQFQVVIKPSPKNIQYLYLDSLRILGIDLKKYDITFIEDNWESPTLGASGIGWEVRQNGMEITQFTYFQQTGGRECRPVMVEITYGLERLAIYLQRNWGVNSVFDIVWSDNSNNGVVKYGDLFFDNEREFSKYNFEIANVEELFVYFDFLEEEAEKILSEGLPLVAYEMVLKMSHVFNLLDARQAISVNERKRFILRVRKLSNMVAEMYYKIREKSGFPLLSKKKVKV